MSIDFSIKKKIGQMLMCGFTSPYLDEKAKRLIDELHVGNFVLFSRNILNYEETLRLCSELSYYTSIKLGARPFISIDEECGMVRRLHGITTPFPGNLSVAATGDSHQAGDLGEMLGRELSDIGINMDFAPSLDVNVNPDNPVIGMRSYGDSPVKVADFGLAMGRGLQKGGVMPVFKHFPGHGDTAVDSHFGIPCISHGMERLQEVELYPFKRAIAEKADCIMISHLLFESIDPENPATLSGKVVNDFLKEQLGFEGLAVTDCMEMEAITKNYGIGEACVSAILAGIDIVLISHTFEAQKAAVEAIYEAVESGRIPIAVIDKAVKKIEHYKHKLNKQSYSADINKTEHMEFAQALYPKSIALLHGDLPVIRSSECICFGVKAFQGTPAEDIPPASLDFAELLAESLGMEHISLNKELDDVLIEKLVRLASHKSMIILGLADAHRFLSQRKLYQKLVESGKKVMVISLRMPYDLKGMPKPAAHLCTFEYTPMAIEALCGLLNMNIKPEGVLPLTV